MIKSFRPRRRDGKDALEPVADDVAGPTPQPPFESINFDNCENNLINLARFRRSSLRAAHSGDEGLRGKDTKGRFGSSMIARF